MAIYSNDLKVIALCYYQDVRNNEDVLVGYNILSTSSEPNDVIDKGKFIDTLGNIVYNDRLVFKMINKDLTAFIKGYLIDVHGKFNISIESIILSKVDSNMYTTKVLFEIKNKWDTENRIIDLNLLSDDYENKLPTRFYSFKCKDKNYGNDLFGVMNEQGIKITEAQFDNIEEIKNKNGSTFFKVKKYKRFGIMNSDGSYVFEPNFDLLDLDYLKNGGYRLIQYHGYYGLMNNNFNIVIEPKYPKFYFLNKKYSFVKLPYDGYGTRWDFLDIQSSKELGLNIQEALEATLIPDFENNVTHEIPVKINYKWGFVNQYGKIIIQPKYSFVTNFSEGLSFTVIQTRNNNSVYPDNSAFIITRDGNILATLSKDLSSDIAQKNEFHDGFIYYKSKKTGKYGYLNTKGQVAIQPVYEEVGDFYNGKAFVNRLGTTYPIDKKGNRINE